MASILTKKMTIHQMELILNLASGTSIEHQQNFAYLLIAKTEDDQGWTKITDEMITDMFDKAGYSE